MEMCGRIIKEFLGHSGCRLFLKRDGNGRFFVRKYSSSPDYNDRLKTQMLKQRRSRLEMVKTPGVWGYGFEKDLFYFDMEYINSQPLGVFIKTLPIRDIGGYVDLLFGSLDNTGKADVRNMSVQDIFQKKVMEVDEKLHEKNDVEKRAFALLKTKDFSNVPSSKCHGDLTMENILVGNSRNVYLIDFLDSFFDSWMMDVAKLLQDIEVKWSYRHESVSAGLEIRLLAAKEELERRIKAMPGGMQKLLDINYILLLNLTRILPYIKEQESFRCVRNGLSRVMDKLRSMKAEL